MSGEGDDLSKNLRKEGRTGPTPEDVPSQIYRLGLQQETESVGPENVVHEKEGSRIGEH